MIKLRRPSVYSIVRLTGVLLLAAELVFLVTTRRRYECSDLAFSFKHPNRTVTLTPVDPERTYNDLLIFSYHQNPDKLALNNANCPVIISGVSGMGRRDLQFLKAYIVKEVILHTRSQHVAYIDWDANFIRRPKIPPGELVTQANPQANSTNTGLLIFFNAKKHIPTIDAWIALEKVSKHDQMSWRRMEVTTNVPVLRTGDGEYGENYNWNVLDKPKTTARCCWVIFHLTWFRFMLDVGIVLAVAAKVYDLWCMTAKAYCPRRAYLSVILVFSVATAVLFTERYHQQVGYESKFFGERICAIPEIALRPEGTIVSRQDTTTAPNEFLRIAIHIFGLDPVASSLSFWFSLLAGLRKFARVMLALEVISLTTLLCFKRSSRAESQIWCTYAQFRDYDAGLPSRGVIGGHWRDGEILARVPGKDGEITISPKRGGSPKRGESNIMT